MKPALSILLLLQLFFGPKAAPARQRCPAPEVPADSCFDLEAMSEGDRQEAERLLLQMLDSEALYTLAGGIKPASSGFVRFTVDSESEAPPELDNARRLLGSLRCGDLVFATVHHFRRLYPSARTGRLVRHFEGIVMATEPLRRTVTAHIGEFSRLGVSPHSHPLEILMAVEHADESPRWRGYGRMFGFPAEAVEFFVRAGEQSRRKGEFVPRRFVTLPTYARADRGVVYAVDRDADETPQDRLFRRQVEAVLRAYEKRRMEYIGPGKRGAARLLRDWYCPDGLCCSLPPPPGGSDP